MKPLEVPVAEEFPKGTTPGRVYPGGCYRRAWGYCVTAMEERGARLLLVHGEVVNAASTPGREFPIGHAWVELPGGVVFDGTVQRFYDGAMYAERLRASAHRKYLPRDAARLGVKFHNYGPWTDEELARLGISANRDRPPEGA